MSHLIKPRVGPRYGPLLERMGPVALSTEEWSHMKYHIRRMIQRYLVPGALLPRQPPAVVFRLMEKNVWPLREYIDNYLRSNVKRTEWRMLNPYSRVAPAREQHTDDEFIDLSCDTDDEDPIGPSKASDLHFNMENKPGLTSSTGAGRPPTSTHRHDQRWAESPLASSSARNTKSVARRSSPGTPADPIVGLLAKHPPKSVERVCAALRALGINDQYFPQADIDSMCGLPAHSRDLWLEAELHRAGTSEGSGEITPFDLLLLKEAFSEREKKLNAEAREDAI
ncbi:hypothetical protein PUNSTDRAFT_137307 [Punctularia strigosozonata HHB-11173 SS5]|uniref:uncharacterized protein n=1 Tax=Punctularia strigosozonata (strain HHB-11173) TaxID=741275 RepID=UPI000441637E|nr:uncharacterized protein PUNSTDRAFT_137307 [Punctularia strigosozonata HHB-11173 SS5]EIN05823.1 hypothetical protein PUNSTDRAFT_137307 [Punctularia strigosozonata HHB-11173 SS5]